MFSSFSSWWTFSVTAATIVPLLGSILSNCLYLTPLAVILEARYTRSLGSINPYPFAVMMFNALGWTIYGCFRQDGYVYSSGFLGVILGLYYVLVCLNVISKKSPNADFSETYVRLERMLIVTFFFWSIAGFIAATSYQMSPFPLLYASNFIGKLCVVSTVVYYASPLSTLRTVLREQDSSSLYLPLILANCTCCTLWCFYGMITGDFNMFFPNFCSMLLCVLQILIRMFIPAREHLQQKPQDGAHLFQLLLGRVSPTYFIGGEKTVLLSQKYSTHSRSRSGSTVSSLNNSLHGNGSVLGGSVHGGSVLGGSVHGPQNKEKKVVFDQTDPMVYYQQGGKPVAEEPTPVKEAGISLV
jgi:solute carrier family 50 protein (sugar transporter)